jgi:hypothetical protein
METYKIKISKVGESREDQDVHETDKQDVHASPKGAHTEASIVPAVLYSTAMWECSHSLQNATIIVLSS